MAVGDLNPIQRNNPSSGDNCDTWISKLKENMIILNTYFRKKEIHKYT